MGAIIPSLEMIETTLDRAWAQGCERHDTRPGRRIYAEAILELYAPLVAEGVGLHIQIITGEQDMHALAEGLIAMSKLEHPSKNIRKMAVELGESVKARLATPRRPDDEGDEEDDRAGDVLAEAPA